MKRPHPRQPRPPARPGLQRPPRTRHRDSTEEMFHGVSACAALFARRPEEIVRVYVTEQRRRQFATLLSWCAAGRRGFQVVAPANLERLTGSLHHEGIAILARQIRRWNLADLLRGTEAGEVTGPLVHLDGVQNPHNLGAILRTAAHFGVGAVTGKGGELPPLSPAAARVAEGAAEVVPLCDLADPVADVARLKKAGYRVVATSSHRGETLFDARLDGRLLVVFGGEGEGISAAIDALADLRVRIPGTGSVESLNVAVAAGVVLGECWRQAGAAPRRPGAAGAKRR